MGKIVSEVNKTDKRPLTDMEKVCIVYGYVRRMAEESKKDGLFKDLSIEEVIRLFIGDEP